MARILLFSFFLIEIYLGFTINAKALPSTTLYVVPFLSRFNDIPDGSLLHPHVSIQQAIDHVEHLRTQNILVNRQITIKLFPTYHFVDTIHLHKSHTHLRLTTMDETETHTFASIYRDERLYVELPKASISGGMPITNWKQVTGNTYSSVVPDSLFVNQLFIGNQRIIRSRVPMDPSKYLQFAAPLSDPTMARLGFQYVKGQFDYQSLDDAMVVVYHSWTASRHYIDRLITANNTIIFTNPSQYPMGEFIKQAQHRFHIENLYESLVPNSFCFVNKTKTVYLMTDGSYDPNKVEVITPVNESIVIIASDDASNPVSDIIIDNISIQHGAWNIGLKEEADGQAAAFLKTAPLLIANATSIVVVGTEISHTGSYGVWIREGTSNILITDSLVTDTGAGGIRIGQSGALGPFHTTLVKILSNEISYGGNVFPSGVAVITHRATDVAIVDNLIHHHRYSGISAGWQWGYAPSGTSNVLIQSNFIHDVGRHVLNDQGGIYMLGIQPGTVISGNVIKNVYSYAMQTWGIYLDEGTSEIVVTNNIVYNTGSASLFQHYGANNTIINNVFARASFNFTPQSGIDAFDGDIHIGLAENHTSLTFTRNIVYDIYQGDNHSAYSCAVGVNAPFFENVYYNPNGVKFLFGHYNLPFDQWQKTGQDNNSIIADPLFAGDVSQCDFFTLQSNSPAARLGFQNITKPSRWTPGCDTEETEQTNQYYYW